jgi:hypothetical protein
MISVYLLYPTLGINSVVFNCTDVSMSEIYYRCRLARLFSFPFPFLAVAKVQQPSLHVGISISSLLEICHICLMSRDGSVGIATGYGLDDRMVRVRFSAGAGNFSLYHRVQTVSGAHPAFHPMRKAAGT